MRPRGVARRVSPSSASKSCSDQRRDFPRIGPRLPARFIGGQIDAFGQAQIHQQMFARRIAISGTGTKSAKARSRVFRDRVLPAFRQTDGGGGGAPAVQSEASMRARADAGIIAIAPIDQIVPAFRTGPGMIGNLIGGQTGGLGHFLRRLVEISRQVIIRNHQRTGLVQQRERRFRFDGQLIERQMIGAERQRLAQFIAPLCIALAGTGIDQVQGDAVENAHRHFQRRFCFIGIVQPAQHFQIGIVQRLHAQRHPIDPGAAVIRKARGVGAGGIGFQGDLHVIGHPPVARDLVQDARHGLARHQGRRAAAEEYRFHNRPVFALRRRGPVQFGFDGADPAGFIE